MSILERMSAAGISQVDMTVALRERGYVVQRQNLSPILRGVDTYPKAKAILAECEKILEEKENEPVG